MKKHLAKTDHYTDLTLSIYETDEQKWSVYGQINPTDKTIVIEIIIHQNHRTTTYNLEHKNLQKFVDQTNYIEKEESNHCTVCGEQDNNLIQPKDIDSVKHHYHKSCQKQLTRKIQQFIENQTTLLTKTQI